MTDDKMSQFTPLRLISYQIYHYLMEIVMTLKKFLYSFVLIKSLCLSPLNAAQELPEGMLHYGMPRTALERVNREMNDFPGSCEADQFKPKYDAIYRHIRSVPETSGVQALLNLTQTARGAASEPSGEAKNWRCTKQVCAGHTLDEKYDSKDYAKDEGKRHHGEYANKVDIDSSSLQLYEVRQHGSKSEAAAFGVLTGAGAVTTAAGIMVFAMPPVGCFGVAACIAGSLANTIVSGNEAKKSYNDIWYNMSLYYKHKENHLQTCVNKKYETFPKSTAELLKAIDSLGILVRIFKIESEIKRLDQENPALRTELQTLRLQLNTLS